MIGEVLLKNCLTGIDNQTYDPARVLWMLIGITFVVCMLVAAFKTGTFNAQDAGIGGGAILGGGGAGVAAKAKTEPGAGQ